MIIASSLSDRWQSQVSYPACGQSDLGPSATCLVPGMLALASSTAGLSVLPRPVESLPGYYRSVQGDGWAAVFLLPDAGEDRLTLPLVGHLVYAKTNQLLFAIVQP